MAIANASMLDEATAAAEAMTLLPARRQARSRTSFFVADDVLPQTHRSGANARRAARHRGGRRSGRGRRERTNAFGVLLQYPGVERRRARLSRARRARVHARGGLVVVAADLLALTLLDAAGRMGRGRRRRQHAALRRADGLRRSARGAIMATRDAFKRSMPGRLVGVTVDAQGDARASASRCRRASSTSGARRRRRTSARRRCCSRSWPACTRCITGPQGLTTHRAARAPPRRDAAPRACSGSASTLRQRHVLRHAHGRERRAHAARIATRAAARRINLRRVDARRSRRLARRDHDARRRRARCGAVRRRGDRAAGFRRARRSTSPTRIAAGRCARTSAVPHASGVQPPPLRDRDAALPAPPRRQGPRARPLDDPARLVHDEAQRDGGDDAGHVAASSRTSIRSRRPSRREGYREMIAELEAMLCAVTGYAAVSLQPNAGSQGEYAGLLIIQRVSRSRAARRIATSA